MTVVAQTRIPGKRLYRAEEIASAVERLAKAIGADSSGQPLLLLGVLKGALYSPSTSRGLSPQSPTDPVKSSWGTFAFPATEAGLESNGEPKVLMDPGVPVEGRNVVIVDDVADNGLTLETLRALVGVRRPASLRQCVLFEKPAAARSKVPLDYVGLPVPEAFVVGYGLDYQEDYRTLPYLASLKEPQRKPTVPFT